MGIAFSQKAAFASIKTEGNAALDNKGSDSILTGIPDVDNLTSGFQQGELIIIGGRPLTGKTTLGLKIAGNVAAQYKKPVAIFSIEASKENIAKRMLFSKAMVDADSIGKGFLKKEDWTNLTNAAGKLAEMSIFIDDSADISGPEIMEKARCLKNTHNGLCLVIIDYLQLMKGSGKVYENRKQEISDICRSLKVLADELRVPVIALSQLKRSADYRRPLISDLMGDIEEYADTILLIYREEVYDPAASTNKNKAVCLIAKNRRGASGTICLDIA